MTVTMNTLIYQPGKTRDVEVSQMYGVVMAGTRKPAYPDDYVMQIAQRWAHWADTFGFLRSLTWGQGPGHETGWFWSRVNVNQVKPEQHNWGGLGADNSGAAGGTFGPTDSQSAFDHGILAYMTHLCLYVHGTPDKWPEHLRQYSNFAYRLSAVTSAHGSRRKPDGTLLGYLGVVKMPQDFTNGRWAESNGIPLGTLDNGYARGMVAKANEVRSMPIDPSIPQPPKEEPIPDLTSRVLAAAGNRGVEVHDIRDRLPTDGRYATKGTNWEHVAVHYTGVWRERNTLEAEISSWRGHANYHVNTHGWPGIAYALGISPSGRLFGLRDAELVGFHAFSANAISLAISNDLTDGQVPTPEMKRTLNVVLRILDELLPRYDPPRTWGHKELAWHDAQNAGTICPGRYLTPLVKQFRTGKDFALDLPPQTVPIQPDHAKIDVAGVGTFWIVGNIFRAWSSVPNNVLIYGYPLTGMYEESGDNVQYFERAVMREKHEGYWPDNFDVDFEAVGRFIHEKRYGTDHQPAQPIPYFKDITTRVWRPETRHSMTGGFLSFWRQNGDIKLFGFPITEEFQEGGRTVQYFERARFEHHPGSNPRWYDVKLGRLGAEALFIRQQNPVLVEGVAA